VATHYDTLGIGRSASSDEVRAAWKRVARELHPDRNPRSTAASEFQQAKAAYDVLSDPTARSIYDRELDRPPGRMPNIPPARSWRAPMRAARWRGPMLRPEEYPDERRRAPDADAQIESAQGTIMIVLALPLLLLVGGISAAFGFYSAGAFGIGLALAARRGMNDAFDRLLAVTLLSGLIGGVVGHFFQV
jgi:curved DNA-binding protein CbpA